MSTGYQIKDQSAPHYLTLQVVYWIDLFSRSVYKDMIIESLRFCQKEKGLEIYTYVIMSNHIHLLVRSANSDLSGTIRDFKKYFSKRIIDFIESSDKESWKNWMLLLFSSSLKSQFKLLES